MSSKLPVLVGLWAAAVILSKIAAGDSTKEIKSNRRKK